MSNRWLFFPAPVSSGPKFVWTGTTTAASGNTLQVSGQVFAGSDGGSSNYFATWGPIRQNTRSPFFEFLFRVKGAYTYSSDWLATVPNGQLSSTTIASGSNILSTSSASIYQTSTSDTIVRLRWTPTSPSGLSTFFGILQAGASLSITLDW